MEYSWEKYFLMSVSYLVVCCDKWYMLCVRMNATESCIHWHIFITFFIIPFIHTFYIWCFTFIQFKLLILFLKMCPQNVHWNSNRTNMFENCNIFFVVHQLRDNSLNHIFYCYCTIKYNSHFSIVSDTVICNVVWTDFNTKNRINSLIFLRSKNIEITFFGGLSI